MVCIFFLLAAMMMLSFSIKRSAESTLKELRETLGGSISLQLNVVSTAFSKEEFKEVCGRFNKELVKNIAATEGIERYNTELELFLYTPDLTLIRGGAYNNEKMCEERQLDIEEKYIIMGEVLEKWPSVIGETHTEDVEHFRNGAFTLAEGRHLQEGDQGKAMISDELAKLNGLSVGDEIYIEINSYIVREGGTLDDVWGGYDMEIVGIFHREAPQAINFYTPESGIANNFIYVDITTAEEMCRIFLESEYAHYSKATFFVEDPTHIDEILSEIRSRYGSKLGYFKLQIDDSVYHSSADPLKFISGIFTFFMLLILVTGVVTLCIVVKMWVQNRSHESGILLSVGIEKKEIVGQYLIEALFAVMVGCILAVGAAGLLSAPISNRVLEMARPEVVMPEEKSQQELEAEIMEGTFDQAGEIIIPAKLPEKFDSRVTGKDFLLITVLIVFTAGAAVCLTFYLYFGTNTKDLLRKLS